MLTYFFIGGMEAYIYWGDGSTSLGGGGIILFY